MSRGRSNLYVLIYYLFSLAATFFTIAIGQTLKINMAEPVNKAISSIIVIAVSAFGAAAVYFPGGGFAKIKKTCFKKPTAAGLWKIVLLSAAMWLSGMFLNFIIDLAANRFLHMAQLQQITKATYKSVCVVNFVSVCAVAPLAEETFFRSALCSVYGEYGKEFAIIASTLMFVMAHGSITVLGLPLVMGLAMAVVLEKTGCIFYCISMHALANGASFVLSLLPKSRKITLCENVVILVFGAAVTIFAVVAYRKKIAASLRRAAQQSKLYFSDGGEIISLAALIIYYIYCNYVNHFTV